MESKFFFFSVLLNTYCILKTFLWFIRLLNSKYWNVSFNMLKKFYATIIYCIFTRINRCFNFQLSFSLFQHEVWEKNQKHLVNFIVTKTQPPITFLPTSHTPESSKLLKESKAKVLGKFTLLVFNSNECLKYYCFHQIHVFYITICFCGICYF